MARYGELVGTEGECSLDLEVDELLGVFGREVWKREAGGEDPCGGEGDGAPAGLEPGLVEGLAQRPAMGHGIAGEEIVREADDDRGGGLGVTVGGADEHGLDGVPIEGEPDHGLGTACLEPVYHRVFCVKIGRAHV